VKLFLDQETAPLFPEFIFATIQNPISYDSCTNTYSYELEYDEDDLNGGALVLLSDHITDSVLVTKYDVLEAYVIEQDGILQDNIDTEEAARIAADSVIQADVDQNEVDSDAADAVLQNNIDAEAVARAAADLLLLPRPIIRTALQGAPENGVAGTAQQERLLVSGTVTTAGNALVVITSSALAGSPRAYAVPVLLADSDAEILAAVVAELTLDTDLTDLFALQAGAGYFQLEVLPVLGDYPANDATLLVTIADSTSTGVDSANSTNQTAGVATTDGTVPGAVGQACHVGDGTAIDIYEALQVDPAFWIPKIIDNAPVSYNATQSVYQKLVASGASGSEILTITDL